MITEPMVGGDVRPREVRELSGSSMQMQESPRGSRWEGGGEKGSSVNATRRDSGCDRVA